MKQCPMFLVSKLKLKISFIVRAVFTGEFLNFANFIFRKTAKLAEKDGESSCSFAKYQEIKNEIQFRDEKYCSLNPKVNPRFLGFLET